MHCGRYLPRALNRRDMLSTCAAGFGALALEALLADPAYGATSNSPDPRDPHAPRSSHYAPRAKNVIFLYMDGGPSQIDTFDPKPRLQREHGDPIKMEVPPTQFNNVGTVMQSPWKFRQRGASGIEVSDLFPAVAECVDDLAIIRSMVSNFSEHTNANYFLHTGNGQQGRPSMGSWVTYGLGTECRDLPGFVVLDCGMIPRGGRDCFTSGFLPASYQATMFQPGDVPVADLRGNGEALSSGAEKMALLRQLDGRALERAGHADALEAAIGNYELAFRMQSAVPELLDFSDESQSTLRAYGVNDEPTRIYGARCLLARRLIERGVRFVEVLCPKVNADRWDQHADLAKGHTLNAQATDRPIAALLRDLKARGLLDETVVVWGGEFGRTPMAQGSNGRDHNPFGFTMWLAGGGVKGGTVHGATDDYGYYAIENKVEVHDLHATLLHLLGLDHTRLTFRFGGRDMRLTDVHGHLVEPILA